MQKKFDSDRDVFFASLALFDRDEAELHHRALPSDIDVDIFVESAFYKALGNPSLLPL